MNTIYTAPNGTADVVKVRRASYRVRTKNADGSWYTSPRVLRSVERARRDAREVDRFKPDGSGRFPVR